MRPNGFDEALEFYKHGKVPLGSWKAWLTSCFEIVERRYSFKCSWISLVGMTVGMLNSKTIKSFERSVKGMFKRSDERRFLLYFVALAHRLAGASYSKMCSFYQIGLIRNVGKQIPDSILNWPKPDKRSANDIIRDLQSCGVAIPLPVNKAMDFYLHLLYGYYVTSRDQRIVNLLNSLALDNSSVYDEIVHAINK